MVSINYSAREVCCKIVYYGPGLSGKTTNLQYVHSKIPQTTRGDLISLATEADRTLYFDFLPINIGNIHGFQAKFQLYTVPGQVYYNATRKLVLRGVDGVVFVADSQPDKMDENIEALGNLVDNLKEYGYVIGELPMVLQYNKRDLPGSMSVEEMNEKLNQMGVPTFEASATVGNGVFDTLKMIIKLVLNKAKAAKVSATPSTASSEPTIASREEIAPKPYPEPAPATTVNTSELAASQATAVVQQAPSSQPSVAQAESHPIRPYPGLHETGGAPVVTQSRADEPEVGPSSEQDSTAEAVTNATTAGGAPRMAPSLRRRPLKKRGFFKRLFGIR